MAQTNDGGCIEPTNCDLGGSNSCIKTCLDKETEHLIEYLPVDEKPSRPVITDNDKPSSSHRITMQPYCNDLECGQRIQIITMEGHEIRMMDALSEASNISLTTSDGSQQLRLDEMNKISWLTSNKHHIILSDADHANSGTGNESAKIKYVDPNSSDRSNSNNSEFNNLPDSSRYNASSYILLQSEKKHNLWLADTDSHPRIHAKTIDGHEILLLDKSPETPNGKIQITTKDSKMQILMNLDTNDISIVNLEGDIRFYSKEDIKFFAEDSIKFYAEEAINFFISENANTSARENLREDISYPIALEDIGYGSNYSSTISVDDGIMDDIKNHFIKNDLVSPSLKHNLLVTRNDN